MSVAVSVSVVGADEVAALVLLPAAVALAVGAVSSLILRIVNVAVLTAETLSLRSVARYSTL